MGFLKENESKIGGFPPIRGRMESVSKTLLQVMSKEKSQICDHRGLLGTRNIVLNL